MNNKLSIIIPQFIFLALFIFLIPNRSLAQISKDSSLHYRKAILNPSQPQDLPSGVHYFTKKKERDIESKDTLNAIYDLRLLSIAEFKIGNNFLKLEKRIRPEIDYPFIHLNTIFFKKNSILLCYHNMTQDTKIPSQVCEFRNNWKFLNVVETEILAYYS